MTTALLVSPSPERARLIAGMCGSLIVATHASTGLQALGMVRDQSPQIVIVCGLPEADDLAAAMREQYPETPVVLIPEGADTPAIIGAISSAIVQEREVGGRMASLARQVRAHGEDIGGLGTEMRALRTEMRDGFATLGVRVDAVARRRDALCRAGAALGRGLLDWWRVHPAYALAVVLALVGLVATGGAAAGKITATVADWTVAWEAGP